MIKEYLNRIGFNGDINPSNEVLFQIHAGHMLHIPFENLDIHLKNKIILDKDHLFNKIIKNKRGGYCYELNGMFYLLLKEIGFDVKMISAQVSIGEDLWTPDFSHLALIVKTDKTYLADVGFGDNFFEPLLFEKDIIQKDIIQKDKAGYFKIVKDSEGYFKLMNSDEGNDFKDGYRFTLNEYKWSDFEKMNVYQQTSENSHFTKNRICSLATSSGRISLSNNKLTVTENGEKKITEFEDKNEFNKILFEKFQIRL
ncbi:MAG: arylamine N-acetyltransferase [Ignavibacteria bacterium]